MKNTENLKGLKMKYWIDVIREGEDVYPHVDCFIKNNYGACNGYYGEIEKGKGKSGTNEKEHCLIVWENNIQERPYNCTGILCLEMLLHIACAFGVNENELLTLKQKAIDYSRKHNRDYPKKGESPIANEVQKYVEKTEKYIHMMKKQKKEEIKY